MAVPKIFTGHYGKPETTSIDSPEHDVAILTANGGGFFGDVEHVKRRIFDRLMNNGWFPLGSLRKTDLVELIMIGRTSRASGLPVGPNVNSVLDDSLLEVARPPRVPLRSRAATTAVHCREGRASGFDGPRRGAARVPR